ncbi:hypothetical protein J8V57_17445 [Xenorhabdus sp. PB61.4]|uniref:hypothetical protein n=1 Tax=Xenorhabdus sp. PB61.4 TaxID=2788940 RepID=UPI001E62A02A|nr:hypothetical protein [Xenorhabdus sp. PB61.4]MCC8368026.1 hypothetical protein [Xenorhabdus sp. PB61.4]
MRKVKFCASLLFLLSSLAHASRWYDVTFSNPNQFYSITIDTPQGSGSKCMYIWAVPNPAITLQPSQTSQKIQIEDNDFIFTCAGDPKFVTWNVHANPLPSYAKYYRAKTCTVEFMHFKSGSTWFTRINSPCTSGKDILVADATCNGRGCLNSAESGVPDHGAINITFFTTNQTSCRDRNSNGVYIDNKVTGIYPTWGGEDVNRVVLAQGKGLFHGDFTYEYGLNTEYGKRFFKYATLANITSSRLQAQCDGNGALGEINLLY